MRGGGKNNLLVTPELGPRVRLRALILTAQLPSTGPLAFDPCRGEEPVLVVKYCRSCETTCPVGKKG